VLAEALASLKHLRCAAARLQDSWKQRLQDRLLGWGWADVAKSVVVDACWRSIRGAFVGRSLLCFSVQGAILRRQVQVAGRTSVTMLQLRTTLDFLICLRLLLPPVLSGL
jgi:hypothetical protein